MAMDMIAMLNGLGQDATTLPALPSKRDAMIAVAKAYGESRKAEGKLPMALAEFRPLWADGALEALSEEDQAAVYAVVDAFSYSSWWARPLFGYARIPGINVYLTSPVTLGAAALLIAGGVYWMRRR